MIDVKDGKKGIQCSCGKFEPYVAYVYAHRWEELIFTCDCGKKYEIQNLEYTEATK